MQNSDQKDFRSRVCYKYLIVFNFGWIDCENAVMFWGSCTRGCAGGPRVYEGSTRGHYGVRPVPPIQEMYAAPYQHCLNTLSTKVMLISNKNPMINRRRNSMLSGKILHLVNENYVLLDYNMCSHNHSMIETIYPIINISFV